MGFESQSGLGFVGGSGRSDEGFGGSGGRDSVEGFGVVMVVIMIRASWVVMAVIFSLEGLQDSAAVPIPFGLSILTLGLCSNTMS